MRALRYSLGLFLIVGVFTVVLFYPIHLTICDNIPHAVFFKRSLLVILLSAFLCLWKIFKGPTASDRIVAIDMLGILIIGICCLLTIITKRNWYIDIGIAWALQSFISILAFSKFLEGRSFDE